MQKDAHDGGIEATNRVSKHQRLGMTINKDTTHKIC